MAKVMATLVITSFGEVTENPDQTLEVHFDDGVRVIPSMLLETEIHDPEVLLETNLVVQACLLRHVLDGVEKKLAKMGRFETKTKEASTVDAQALQLAGFFKPEPGKA